MRFDHVALNVADIRRSVDWYRATLGASVLYLDDTWAFLEAGGVKIALTLRRQHPAHIAFDVGSSPSAEFLRSAKVHRDGSLSRYVADPDGNAIEWIHYPAAGGSADPARAPGDEGNMDGRP
jgi:catechol 2,3-dioxygenase-like lactoylglutathione lyase family enzyme